jgi:hypothetical protein
MPETPDVVFFDLGDTLGSAVVSQPPVHLVRFDPFSFAQGLLAALRAKSLRLGIISNTGNDGRNVIDAVLDTAGILDFFEPALRLYSHDVGLTKNSPAIFLRAVELAGHIASPQQCLFVGEDAAERGFAIQAGLRVCPHPLLIDEVIAGESLRYVRVTIPPARVQEGYGLLRQRAFVPLHVAGPGGRVVYGITSQRVATELVNLLLQVDLLGNPNVPDASDLYLLRDDLARASGFGTSAGGARNFFADDDSSLLLSATEDGLVVALPAGRSPGEFHFAEARHGHTLKLMPDPHLLDPATGGGVSGFAAAEAAAQLTPEEQQALSGIGNEAILSLVQRYSGIQPLSSGDPETISSRHIADADGDNERAVMALVHDLEIAGQGLLQVRMGRFSHRGLMLYNVEAELPGASPELVLITAHLDSTAANDPGFDEAHGAAPGADDDASGVAAVVLAAECFARLAAAGPPARTIRFVLFNAEEEGLIGSQVYARQQRALQAPIAAVFQMDMIGYHEHPPRTWEVHAGFAPSAAVQARSLALARVLGQVAPLVSPALEPPQIYGAGDPAAGRSDHAPFQAQGYAACVVSEDFFVGPGPDSPAPQANPNYHQAGDTVVVADFAADIARAVAAAAWISAKGAAGVAPQFNAPSATSIMGDNKMAAREIDTSNFHRANRPVTAAAAAAPSGSHRLRLNARASFAAAMLGAAATTPRPTGSVINRALSVLRTERARAAGFAAAQPADGIEFVPDPVPQRTSSAAQIVHFQQFYRGVPIFRTAHMVRFAPEGQQADVLGDDVVLTTEVDTAPTLVAEQAVLIAAKHLASAGPRTFKDEFGQEATQEPVKLDGFEPMVIVGFPTLPSQPAAMDWVATSATNTQPSEKPFSSPVPAHLVIFDQPVGPRLGWYAVFTREAEFEQYAVIVSADQTPGEILYVRDMMHMAQARGNVFEFSPGIADRRMTGFPRPIADYPIMPGAPLAGFPADWVEVDRTVGNATVATLNFTSTSLTGRPNGNVVEFNPAERFGNDQKLLNIFYFCNYMHDFLYILGFDEAAGNFQKVHFTHMGIGNDPVRARAHSGPVPGTANMSTAADGTPPVMNMGLVQRSDRHTAFDADVVFHEFTHGLTNRLVGGTRQGHTLDAPQSQGMGEGWSDFFALTIQNFFRAQNGQAERIITGDWVVNNLTGIRSNPYDDNYPFTYGNVSTFPRFDPNTGFPDPNGLPDEHQTGEIWCAALMMMVRRMRAALGDVNGYRLGWQMVTDGLKLTPANPTFLDARDAILLALDHMLDQRHIAQAVHDTARQAALTAFGRFGMGPNAASADAGVDGIVEDVVPVPAA